MRSLWLILFYMLPLAGVGTLPCEAQHSEVGTFLASGRILGTIYMEEAQVALRPGDRDVLGELAQDLRHLGGEKTMVRIEGYAGGQRSNRAESAMLRAAEVAAWLRRLAPESQELTLTGYDSRTIPGLAGRKKDRVDVVIYDRVMNVHDADVETIISR